MTAQSMCETGEVRESFSSEGGAVAHMPWRAQDDVRPERPEYDGRKALQCHVSEELQQRAGGTSQAVIQKARKESRD